MKTLTKSKTIETNNLQQGVLIIMEFAFYNVNSIQGFTSMINVVRDKTRMIWVFITYFIQKSPSQNYLIYS